MRRAPAGRQRRTLAGRTGKDLGFVLRAGSGRATQRETMASIRVTRSTGEGGVIHHADCGFAGAARVDRLTLRMLHWTKNITGRMHTVWKVRADWRTLQPGL